MQRHHNGDAGDTKQGVKATNESHTLHSNCRQTEILLRFSGRKSGAEKWAAGNTRCNKGDADHAEGKEKCLQPVKH